MYLLSCRLDNGILCFSLVCIAVQLDFVPLLLPAPEGSPQMLHQVCRVLLVVVGMMVVVVVVVVMVVSCVCSFGNEERGATGGRRAAGSGCGVGEHRARAQKTMLKIIVMKESPPVAPSTDSTKQNLPTGGSREKNVLMAELSFLFCFIFSQCRGRFVLVLEGGESSCHQYFADGIDGGMWAFTAEPFCLSQWCCMLAFLQ